MRILPTVRYAAITLAVLLVLVALALTFMDWNRFKRPLERMASARFGRDITFSGPLQVQVWSHTPTVTVSGLVVGGPPWEKEHPVARVERLRMQLRLLSLLGGHLVLDRLELRRPDIYLHQEKSGRANWTFESQALTNARASQPAHLPPIRDLRIESGSIELSDELRRLRMQGTLQAEPFRVQGKGTINDQPFELDITGGALQSLTPDRPYPFTLAITAGENAIKADGKVLRPFDMGQLELQVEASGRDLAQLFYLTQVALPNSPPFRVRAHIVRNGWRFRVTDVDGSLGQSDISGTVDVDASQKRADVHADLLSHHLRLKDLAAVTGSEAPAKGAPGSAPGKVPTGGAARAPAPAQPRLFPDAHLQPARLRAMDADVHFRATSVEGGTVPFREFSLHAKLDDGALAVEPFEFDLPQGHLAGELHIDARTDAPRVRIEVRARDIRLDELRGKGPNAVPPLDGTLQARALIEGIGDSVHRLMSNANGELTFIVPQGDIRSAFAELAGGDVAKGIGLKLASPDSRIPVRCAVAQLDVRNGTAQADHVVIDTQDVLITGSGRIALGPETLDLTLQGKPKKAHLIHLRSPVQIRGQLLRPTVHLEPGHLLKQGAVAATLGLLTPMAAVLAFVDPGLAKDQNCAQLISEGNAQGELAPAAAPGAPQ